MQWARLGAVVCYGREMDELKVGDRVFVVDGPRRGTRGLLIGPAGGTCDEGDVLVRLDDGEDGIVRRSQLVRPPAPEA
jgi:hypothetical protein